MIQNKTQKLKQELDFLYKVASSVYSLELDQVLKKIVQLATNVTKGDSCLIYILNKKKKELVLRASKNPHHDLLKNIKLKVGEGITGWVAQNKKVVAISQNAKKDKRFRFFQRLPEDEYQAFLSAPILNKQGVVGVINIQHIKKHQHLPMEKKLLKAMGRLVGGAVENAMLIEETLMLQEALEIRKLVEKAKGIIMKRKHITEDKAYKLLLKTSMNQRKSLKQVTEAVVLSEKISLGLD